MIEIRIPAIYSNNKDYIKRVLIEEHAKFLTKIEEYKNRHNRSDVGPGSII